MTFQLKEKAVYSESDLLHFGEKVIFGDIVNSHFPDYSGISVGAVIYQSSNKEEVYDLKTHLELQRIKTIDEMLIAFFDDDELAETFYSSDAFSKLQELYAEFNLKLIRRNHNQMEVEGLGFYIPSELSDKQVLTIQELLNIYFFTVEAISLEEISGDEGIDWNNRLSILYQGKKQRKDKEVAAKNDSIETLPMESKEVSEIEKEVQQKPWWKFW